MDGQIVSCYKDPQMPGYNGIVRATDGSQYTFSSSQNFGQWQNVSFDVAGGVAQNVRAR